MAKREGIEKLQEKYLIWVLIEDKNARILMLIIPDKERASKGKKWGVEHGKEYEISRIVWKRKRK